MSDITILGAGAFGAALAVALGAVRPVTLWAREPGGMQADRVVPRLPGVTLPAGVTVTGDPAAVTGAATLLLACPAQSLRQVLSDMPLGPGAHAVACCKGIDAATLATPADTIADAAPQSVPMILTGPSFAHDLAAGLPTALTLACGDAEAGAAVQTRLATPVLRPYLSADPRGAALGGALKNVVAIACGACIGAGLGDSARAALMARGFAEMTRLAVHLGADPATLTGLAGLGDLSLTCMSEGSRNFRLGLAVGRGQAPDGALVEGVATARAVAVIAARDGLDLPVMAAAHGLGSGRIDVDEALRALLSRPLRAEGT
ncbi:MAG: NAD(P)H-dependent glycerol-3-phosphate dehydrogenase [Paracoccaceae bacterium]